MTNSTDLFKQPLTTEFLMTLGDKIKHINNGKTTYYTDNITVLGKEYETSIHIYNGELEVQFTIGNARPEYSVNFKNKTYSVVMGSDKTYQLQPYRTLMSILEQLLNDYMASAAKFESLLNVVVMGNVQQQFNDFLEAHGIDTGLPFEIKGEYEGHYYSLVTGAFPSVYSKLASHTGYHSLGMMPFDAKDMSYRDSVTDIISKLYSERVASPLWDFDKFACFENEERIEVIAPIFLPQAIQDYLTNEYQCEYKPSSIQPAFTCPTLTKRQFKSIIKPLTNKSTALLTDDELVSIFAKHNKINLDDLMPTSEVKAIEDLLVLDRSSQLELF